MTANELPPVALLGPQRTAQTVGAVLEQIAPEGTVATITAGWQEREGEDDELQALLRGRTLNLALYRRAERVWREAPKLRSAHRKLQRRVRLLRLSYNVRLDCLMDAWSALEEMDGEAAVLDPERHAALEAIRDLDARHLTRVAELRAEYEERVKPGDHPGLRRERDEVAQDLERASAVAVAGGHVAILLNRLRMFGVEPLLAGKPVVAWSAGAMALADRIVLFHDSPPQGPGHAEAFDVGLQLAGGVVPLPHARTRLRLDDRRRVSRLARRFGPAVCVALDTAEGIVRRDGAWQPASGTEARGARWLDSDGRVREMGA